MAAIRTRRMLKERENLEKETTDYACFFEDDNLFRFFVYLTAPDDSVYCHKLLKLEFEIPPRYPIVPPKVKFIQHHGLRIHPNLYVDGKLCLSILGTWPGEPWALSMTTDGVLRTVQSLLDNKPYMHEPEQKDHPEYSEFVRYTTWHWLLLDYLEKETHPAAKAWLQKYIAGRADKMMDELLRQQALALVGPAPWHTAREKVSARPYDKKELPVEYPLLIQQLQTAIQASKFAQPPVVLTTETLNNVPVSSMRGAPAQGTKPTGKPTGTSGTLKGGLSEPETQVKRKIAAEDEVDTSQTPTKVKAFHGQQAKNSTPEHSERSPKRTKKTAEVIDLT